MSGGYQKMTVNLWIKNRPEDVRAQWAYQCEERNIARCI
jgi:hypothetical protein